MMNTISASNASTRTSSATTVLPDAQLPSISVPRISCPEPSPSLGESAVVLPPILDLPRPLPLWLDPAYARHIVKGNFMTLSARPKTVDPGEWVAHQVVEHYRNLWNFVRVVHAKEDNGDSICSPSSCPKMSAGENHSYIWLDQDHDPVDLPAYEYMTLMQRWISGKIDDATLFPTHPSSVSFSIHPDYTPSSSSSSADADSTPRPAPNDEWLGSRSGFPKHFSETAQLIFRQIFRVYAHLYWDHFVTPFYHLNLEKQLNSCFSHFLLTATTLDMLSMDELEPMQYLVDLWAADGTLPQGSRPYLHANLERGRYLMELGRRE